MSKEEFFENIDRKVDQMQAKQDAQQKQQTLHETAVKRFVQESAPHLEEYKSKLEQRGVETKFDRSEITFSFLMLYNKGGHHGFTLTRNYPSEHYVVKSDFKHDGEGHFTSEGNAFVAGKMWTWAGFEAYVQESIENFFFYSDRNGGYRSE